ncbi:retinal cone rhodopsin-sensitive cGMP 3',5'-cyclic phosphodiesterase subunit gamma-like isoform X1 [Thunnus albacares]|uniref:retinal cone rhodopsin-sensitive cGMP 3',5'-cyclic phosphodiesterase subunit gamma-like isoform X1 n=1 Tax=Thunnus albacares TaxID=8236 RepID=UPI001CF6E3C7|nr:retinal cone rhodopsin-sensitive cGMP 3',5'-cyclic phosphodiesterase subunit gamma-like isoform X1 [Thunnus albacares]
MNDWITYKTKTHINGGNEERELFKQFTPLWTRQQTDAYEMNAAAEGTKAAPPKFKQKDSRQFKSKAPKPGQKGFDNDVPGMEGLGDSAVVCPWEAFGDMELSDLAQFGIV